MKVIHALYLDYPGRFSLRESLVCGRRGWAPPCLGSPVHTV